MISDEDIEKAWDRIARTRDGQTVYLHLQKILCGILESTDPGALREHQGYRKHARDLMARMAKGIEESAGSESNSGERPVVFTVAGPVQYARQRRGRRVRDAESA